MDPLSSSGEIAVHADWSARQSNRPTPNEFLVLSEASLSRADTARVGDVAAFVDARLDNEPELRDRLSVGSSATTAELFARAYSRWGDLFAEHVAGDFAAVLWEQKRRRLIAVRDPFGVKPLFYRRSAAAIWIASDQRKVLSTFQGFPAVDEHAVVEHLLAIYRSAELTFFRDIRRLAPGHVLTVDDRELGTTRYWYPPPASTDRTHTEPTREHLDEFARLFKRAVANRLAGAAAAVVHVSGGVDSSCIAVTCDLLARSGHPVPRLSGASASYPGLRCDESTYVDAVARGIGFPIERWDGTASESSDLVDPAVDFPAAQAAFTDGTHGDLTMATRLGARVILSGTGGDELTVGIGTVRDMLARREWSRAAKRVFSPEGEEGGSMLGRLKSLAVQYLPRPIEARRIRSHTAVPDWLTAPSSALVAEIIVAGGASVEGSHAASSIWDRIGSAQLVRGVESHQRQALPFGVEYRFPFLDRDLVRFMVSVACGYWPHRIRPHQQALRDDLPSAIFERRTKADLTPAFGNRIRRAAPLIDRQFRDSVWASQPYVSRERALAAWRGFDIDRTNGYQCRQLWAMVTLEAWLRKVLGYSLPSQREGRAYV